MDGPQPTLGPPTDGGRRSSLRRPEALACKAAKAATSGGTAQGAFAMKEWPGEVEGSWRE